MAGGALMNHPATARKRRTHKKSRNGCKNCKLRRVKCDETRPTCNNCDRFMVTCSYDHREADLHTPYSQRSDQLSQPPILDSASLNDALLGMINSTLLMRYPKDCGEPLQLNLQDLDKLRRWQNRTVLTIGSPDTAKVYQKEVIKLVARYPYLMHCILALTSRHDRYLLADIREDPHRKALEYFHYGRAAALFNYVLSRPAKEPEAAEHDSLWSTAVFLGNIASSTIDTDATEESWPIKDGTPGEALTWLRVHEGLGVLWGIVQPYAPGHMFHELVNTPEHQFMMTKLNPFIQPGIEGVPPDFVQLCGLDENSTLQNNPYQRAIRTLVPLIDLPWSGTNGLKFMGYTSGMDLRYKNLLKQKDTAALVLLAWWYALILRCHWHLSRRALLECKSICIYLGRKCPENTLVQKLLKFPRQKTGILRELVKEKAGTIPWTSTEGKLGAILVPSR